MLIFPVGAVTFQTDVGGCSGWAAHSSVNNLQLNPNPFEMV